MVNGSFRLSSIRRTELCSNGSMLSGAWVCYDIVTGCILLPHPSRDRAPQKFIKIRSFAVRQTCYSSSPAVQYHRTQDRGIRLLANEEAATIMFTLLDEQKAKKFWEEEIRQETKTGN